MGFALTVTAGPDEGRRYVFDDEATLGRTGETDVVVQDAAASRLHARIWARKPGRLFLEDSGSANGTLLNGDKVKRPAELMDGDVISIGSVEFTFEYLDDADVEREVTNASSQEDLYSTMDTSDAPLQGTMFGDDLGSMQSMPSLPPRPAPRPPARGAPPSIEVEPDVPPAEASAERLEPAAPPSLEALEPPRASARRPPEPSEEALPPAEEEPPPSPPSPPRHSAPRGAARKPPPPSEEPLPPAEEEPPPSPPSPPRHSAPRAAARKPPPPSEEPLPPAEEEPPPSPPRPARRDAGTSTRSRATRRPSRDDRTWFVTKLVVGIILVGALIGTALWALPILLAPPAP